MADTIGFKPTSVNQQGLTALIRNLGRDCTPEQFMREFVQNSIEACVRTGLPGRRVVVDYNHSIHTHSGMFKLCFTDNGDGMSLEQMNNLLNSISASGSSGNTYENYGVGAKISSLTRNHFGVQYESWKGGIGHTIIIRYNPKFDVFGIQGFNDASGNVVYHRTIADAQRPDFVLQHGTRVTLFGNTLDQDTMAPPWGVSGDKGSWLFEYLNRRYFELPAGIAIDVRQGYDQDPQDSERHYMRPLESFSETLSAQSMQQGTLALQDAKVHWFILQADSVIKGHSGLVNQGEIFNVESDRSSRLTHFGILLGRERVVILVEPHEASQNIARTHLKKPDGSDFSWHHWQDAFRAHLPQEIQAFLDSLLSQRTKASSSKEIHQRLMSLRSLYDLSGFEPLVVQAPIENLKVPVPEALAVPDAQPVSIEALADMPGDVPQQHLQEEVPQPAAPVQSNDETKKEPQEDLKQEVHAQAEQEVRDEPTKQEARDEPTPSEPAPQVPETQALEVPEGVPSSEEVPAPGAVPAPEAVVVPEETPVPQVEEQPNYFPRVEWTTQAHSPQLAGRAAEFIEYSNIVLANQDFKGLQDLFKYFDQQYTLSDTASQAVRHAIMQNAEQALMESVAGVLSLKNDPSWRGHYQQALSKEALSALVMQRFWSVKAIEKDLLAQIEGDTGGGTPT